MTYTLYNDNCESVLRTLLHNSIDALITDPPAGISFMDKKWDGNRGGRDQWIAWLSGIAAQCLRVLKPGAHALVWALPRTSHWTATAFENAGFEVRDRIIHLSLQGFPHGYDISKAIDRLANAKREIIGRRTLPYKSAYTPPANRDQSLIHKRNVKASTIGIPITRPATQAATQWEGWKTALRPNVEDWWLLRKPISERTIAENILKWGVGALNIDACRIGEHNRYPAHLTHDGSEEITSLFPETVHAGTKYGYGDTGNAARFYEPCPMDADDLNTLFLIYCKKVDKADRSEGLCPSQPNNHPTVKPTPLMRWLSRLVTPAGGTILDPFMGSGSTGKAALLEGFAFQGIEIDPDYFAIAEARCKFATSCSVTQNTPDLTDLPLFSKGD